MNKFKFGLQLSIFIADRDRNRCMLFFGKNSVANKAKAQAKADYEKVLKLDPKSPNARALRSKQALRARNHIDQVFIEAALKTEAFLELCQQELIAGRPRPEPPGPTTFHITSSNMGKFYTYIPSDFANEIFAIGSLYQTTEVSGQEAVDKVQAVADRLFEEIGLETNLNTLQFLRDELDVDALSTDDM